MQDKPEIHNALDKVYSAFGQAVTTILNVANDNSQNSDNYDFIMKIYEKVRDSQEEFSSLRTEIEKDLMNR